MRRIFFILSFLAWALLVSCAVNKSKPAPNPTVVTQPVQHPLDSINKTITDIQKPLKWITVIGWVVAGLACGLLIYGLVTADKLLEHLGAIIGSASGGCAGLSLAGLIILPFAPWLVLGFGGIALGVVGYFVYTDFIAKNPAVTVVASSTNPTVTLATQVNGKVTGTVTQPQHPAINSSGVPL